MGGQARLSAIEAVPALAAALRRFGEEAQAALVELDMEIGRTVDWIQRGQRAYWAEETRRGYRNVTEAQAVLDLALITRQAGDHQPLCWEEKKALEAAKRRLRLSQAKEEAVQRWSRGLDHEVIEYRGVSGQLEHWLECDLPQALAALDRMGRALELYVAVAMPEPEAEGRPRTAASPEETPQEQPAEETPEHQEPEENRPCESET